VQLSRRHLLLATTVTGYGVLAATTGAHTARAATTAAVPASRTAAVTASAQTDDPDFQELDAVIQDAMARYRVPGVAVGVIDSAREYTNGYGVTNVDAPVPVDANTLFQTGSITKTYTATLVMRLVQNDIPGAVVGVWSPMAGDWEAALGTANLASRGADAAG
jgi:hypothetical protein